MKKFILGFICGALLFGISTGYSSQKEIKYAGLKKLINIEIQKSKQSIVDLAEQQIKSKYDIKYK